MVSEVFEDESEHEVHKTVVEHLQGTGIGAHIKSGIYKMYY